MFKNNRLKANPERCLGIVAGALPAVMIYGAKYVYKIDKNAGKDVKGRPAAMIFGLMWLLIVGILAFSGVVAALRFDTTSLVLQSSVALVFALLAVAWMRYYHSSKDQDITSDMRKMHMSSSVQALGLLVLSSILYLTIETTATTDTNEDDIRIMLASVATLPVGWGLYALILNFFEANE